MEEKPKIVEPGLMWGICAYLTAFSARFIQKSLIGYPDYVYFTLPAIPWGICLLMLLKYRRKRLRAYWWVVPSAIPALLSLLLIGVMMLAWSIGGFV